MEMEGYVSTAEERMQNEIDELEQENRLLRARNTRLEAELKAVPVLSAGPITSEMVNWSAEDKAELVAVIAKHTSPVQEPVAEVTEADTENYKIRIIKPQPAGTKLYTNPPAATTKDSQMALEQPRYGKSKVFSPAAQRQWVDLTDRQIESIFLDAGWSWGEKADMYVPAVREVLKLFKETNE